MSMIAIAKKSYFLHKYIECKVLHKNKENLILFKNGKMLQKMPEEIKGNNWSNNQKMWLIGWHFGTKVYCFDYSETKLRDGI